MGYPVDSLIWFPAGEVPPRLLAPLLVRSFFDVDGENQIQTYAERDGLLGLPRSYARHALAPAELSNATAPGEAISTPLCPAPRGDAQAAFFDGVLDNVRRQMDTVVSAATGTGKTVAGCYVIHHLRVATLVVVHMEDLAKQWRGELVAHCGLAADEIGLVGDGQCDWRGKKVVIGMLQTLRQKEMPDAFWAMFGLTILDEVHKMNAAKSSVVLQRARSLRRLALSATVKRRDGLSRVVEQHMGAVKVVGQMAPVPCRVHVVPWAWPPGSVKWPKIRAANDRDPRNGLSKKEAHGLVVKKISQSQPRNARIAELCAQAWRSGRDGIVVSEGVEHLHVLRDLCVHYGVAAADCGIYSAQLLVPDGRGGYLRVDDAYRSEMVDAPRVKGKKQAPVLDAEGRQIVDRVKRYVLDSEGGRILADPRAAYKRRAPSAAEREDAKDNRRLTFATYGMLMEAINVTKWNFGIDATPRSSATQLIGRIRRKVLPKEALWITLLDEGCPLAQGYFKGRFNDYATSGATVHGL